MCVLGEDTNDGSIFNFPVQNLIANTLLKALKVLKF